MDQASEIAQIEHELEILRANYADMERGGVYLKNFFTAVLIGALVALGFSLLVMNIRAIGASAIAAAMTGVVILIYRGRWIELMNFRRRFERISRLDAIEMMIRVREERLAAIRRVRRLSRAAILASSSRGTPSAD